MYLKKIILDYQCTDILGLKNNNNRNSSTIHNTKSGTKSFTAKVKNGLKLTNGILKSL